MDTGGGRDGAGWDRNPNQEPVMTLRRTLAAILSTTALTGAAPMALADGNGHQHDAPILHVNAAYESCFFDLHPELTQAEFDEFAREGGIVMHDLQLASAAPIGRGQVEIDLDYSRTVIDDSKGAWNNTMSHPTEDHYLGDVRAFPRLGVRVGVARRVDVGVWGTLDPNANYGFLGVQSKVTIVEQDESTPVSVALRPTAVSLLGPSELFVADLGLDASVSRDYKGLSPYLGLSAHTTGAFERSDDVDLDPGTAAHMSAFAGLAYGWRALRVAAHAEAGPLTVFAARVGGSF
jgi:hypothetical protein